METPLPNFYFMGVQFVHLFALSVWVGGLIVLRIIVVPSLSYPVLSQQVVQHLSNEVFVKFNKATLFCAGLLITTGVIKFLSWENLTPWNSIRYFSIFVMSLVSLYVVFTASPRIDPQGVSHSKPKSSPAQLNLHHTLSDRLMMLSLICGMTALLMA